MGKIGFDTAIWTQNLGQLFLYRPGQWITYLHLSYDPYGPVCAFITNVLRKSPYEGRMRWREQGRKKGSRPAKIAYGPHTGILSIPRARIPSSNIWTNCDGVQQKRGWARCDARLYMYDAGSARFWLEENTIHQVPPAWACVPVIKQKPCHKYHYDNVIMVSFITRRFVVVSSQYAEKIKRINEGCMAAH